MELAVVAGKLQVGRVVVVLAGGARQPILLVP